MQRNYGFQIHVRLHSDPGVEGAAWALGRCWLAHSFNLSPCSANQQCRCPYLPRPGRPGVKLFTGWQKGFEPCAHCAFYTLLGKKDHILSGREHGAGHEASYM